MANKINQSDPLKIKHRVLEVWSCDTATPKPSGFLHHQFLVTRCADAVKQAIQVASPALARKVGVVRRRYETDCLCRAGKHVADGIGQCLQDIWSKMILVVNDVVMCRSGSSMKASMGLEEKVEMVDRCDASVDNSSCLGIAVAIGLLLVGGIEPGMVAFSLPMKPK